MKIRHIVGCIFAAIFIVWGFEWATDTGDDVLDGRVVVSGPLVPEYAAVDPDCELDVPFSYPLLYRRVEMAQYRKKVDGVHLELLHWKQEARIEETSGDKKTVYENPPFPTWIRTDIFGSLSIRSKDQTLRLNKYIIRKLFSSKYTGLSREPESYVVARKQVKDGEEGWRNKRLIDRFADTDTYTVGDVIVTWSALKSQALAQTYTIVGDVHDGVIGGEDYRIHIYDRELTADEFQEIISSRYRSMGMVLLCIGVICAALSLLPKLRRSRG